MADDGSAASAHCAAAAMAQQQEPGQLPDQQLLGGAICLVGSTLAIVGMNMQRWSLLQLEAEEAAAAQDAARSFAEEEEGGAPPKGGEKAVGGGAARGGAAGRWWFVSLLVYTVGQLVQMAALAFATQTLVSALSNVSLVTNVCVAHWWFGEPFAVCPPPAASRCRRIMGWDLASMLILGAGSTAVVVFAPGGYSGDYTVDCLRELFFTSPYIVFFCATAAAAAAALCCIYGAERAPHFALGDGAAARLRRREGLIFAVATAGESPPASRRPFSLGCVLTPLARCALSDGLDRDHALQDHDAAAAQDPRGPEPARLARRHRLRPQPARHRAAQPQGPQRRPGPPRGNPNGPFFPRDLGRVSVRHLSMS